MDGVTDVQQELPHTSGCPDQTKCVVSITLCVAPFYGMMQKALLCAATMTTDLTIYRLYVHCLALYVFAE